MSSTPVGPGGTKAGRDSASTGGAGQPSFSAPTISLPKGGGAIRGMGEKFAANLVTGTGSLSIPLGLSPGRAGFGPQLSVSYDSGAGNGPFGFGWNLALPSVTRKTDKGLPRYNDTEESDVYILSGAEDLVPVLVKVGEEWQHHKDVRTVANVEYRIEAYRPRVEGLFARIERWTNRQTGVIHWRSITRDNVTTLYGKDNNSRIFDPADPDSQNPKRIFSWLICESYDDKGNAIVYEYEPENTAGVDLSQAHERNRTPSSISANRYLKRIKYGNRISRLLQPELSQAGWMFEAVFDYGEHDPDEPKTTDSNGWLCRHDPFSSYRAGFEVRTYRLCQRVLMFHHFPDEQRVGQDCLVRSTDFLYRNTRNNPDDLSKGHPVASFIACITQSGYKRKAAGYLKKSLPSLEFQYTEATIEEEVREVDLETLENLPYGLDGSRYQWIDLHGEGLPGILTEQAGAWFYKRNLTPINTQYDGGKEKAVVRFAATELVAEQPLPANLNTGQQQLLDLAGDGQVDLVQFDRPRPGFYERTQDGGWSQFVSFEAMPNVQWDDPNLKFVDLTGDGRADIIIAGDDIFTWYPSLAEAGFGAAEWVRQALDEEKGPRLVFADSTQSVYLADMSGDGLTDLARIRNGEACYWPNLGYGRFGTKVMMDDAPCFDFPDLFDQKRIRLADIDGSGVTDIIYLGSDGVEIYFNQSGNRWSQARKLNVFPQIDNLSAVMALDLLGNGTACLVWSSALPDHASRPMRYVDLMSGQKPHLLVSVKNNLGSETRMHYAPSTKFYLADKFADKPWASRLPFPVHVVERVETLDHISRNRFVTRYAYHHGYFDGGEREFRGFGMVEQWDTEEFAMLSASGSLSDPYNIGVASHVPPLLTRTWFHTGVWTEAQSLIKQFAGEYYREGDTSMGEAGLSHEQLQAMSLEDTVSLQYIKLDNGSRVPWVFSTEEEKQACRALKGSILRQEVYALDGTEETDRPYSVSERNYAVEMLQPRGGNKHAVFFAHPRETIDFHFERELFVVGGFNLADPRVAHTMILDVDGFGNVLRSVAIGYGRRYDDPDSLLTVEDRQNQKRTLITYTENHYTNPVQEGDAYRVPLMYETLTYELYKVVPASNHQGITNLFRLDEVEAKAQAAGDGSHDIPYEDFSGQGATTNAPWRRLIEHTRILYRANDLSGALQLGDLESRALPFETYKLAFTPGLLSSVYTRTKANKPPENLLPDIAGVLHGQGGYVDLDANNHWWIASGHEFFHPNPNATSAQEFAYAQSHFFLPHRFQDVFLNNYFVSYDEDSKGLGYDLLVRSTLDALGNQASAIQDYRVLLPRLVIDPNGNRIAATYDALGMVAGTAVRGKESENLGDSLDGFEPDLDEVTIITHLENPLANPHDILGQASTRMVYDLYQYQRTSTNPNPQPNVVYMLTRETHESDLLPGELTGIQHSFSYSDGLGREVQKKIQAEPGPIVAGGATVSPRWVGSGWTVFNNKGKPVRRYEPFFSSIHEFELAKAVGVSPIFFYDPLGRVVATLYPNHTCEKAVFNPWQQYAWGVNDMVLQSDPKNDPDVGDFFSRLPETEYLPTWHAQRENGAPGAREQSAATQAAVHANTPTVTYFDSLGRAFLTVVHNRFERNQNNTIVIIEEKYSTRVEFDIEGNDRVVSDARQDVATGKARVAMRYGYDMLSNRIHLASIDAGERWILNDVYGKLIRAWDSNDHLIRHEYDSLRRPTHLYVQSGGGAEKLAERVVYGEGQPNDQALNLRGKLFKQFDGAGILTNIGYDFKGNLLGSARQLLQSYKDDVNWEQSPALESEIFTSGTTYDAINRPVTLTMHDASVIRPIFNEANLLEQVKVNLRGAATETLFVTDIDYNARGQRELIDYGNQASTTYAYDPSTFRLINLKTTRKTDNAVLQDMSYTYDPVGNITAIADAAQQTIYFNNQVVSAESQYVYDAINRLISANGREHIGQVAQPETSWSDEFRVNLPHPNDGQAMRNYNESYYYDAVGNILKVAHAAANGDWTRTYGYDGAGPNPANNRLTSTMVGAVNEQYAYDAHGNMIEMPHLPLMEWDFNNQLRMTQRQIVNNGPGERTYYVYDSAGQRVRKVTETANGTKKRERIYQRCFELYREYDANASITIERETLDVRDNDRRIALVETRTQGDDGSPQQLTRYQLSNHLNSASLELDAEGLIISYEEYYPYGSTSYQAGRSFVEVKLKRYRYIGRERDEETGLCHHGARYYAPWLGSWTSCDPAGMVDGINLYAYAKANPIKLVDPHGTQSNTLSEFEQNWFMEVAMPILNYDKFQSKAGEVSISLEKRILMAAQARAESVTKWKDEKGVFKEQEGLNMMNVQTGKGTAGSKKVQRWEYIATTLDLDSVRSRLGEMQDVGDRNKWAKFDIIQVKITNKDKTVTEKTVVRELKLITVTVPLFKTKEDAIKAYLEVLQSTWSNAFKALTTDKGTKEEFFAGLKTYGTHGDYKDPKYMPKMVSQTTGVLIAASGELITELGKELANAKQQQQALPKEQQGVLQGKIDQLEESIKNLGSIKSEAEKLRTQVGKQ